MPFCCFCFLAVFYSKLISVNIFSVMFFVSINFEIKFGFHSDIEIQISLRKISSLLVADQSLL